ncbi:dephospho- kinase [Pyrenophora seminiperda CCB06]|uniref:Dephospho-kinase n=1 Tax=Pyrenophora seminiperda CCB06 TaxID=1302712 RepID=A0A3M7M127_9PLEO|nr:dephospho- kinase [Pyrenophora seminiperda CCB06]
MPSSRPPHKHRLFFIRPASRKTSKSPKHKHSANYNTYICEPSWCTPHKPSQNNCAAMSAITPQSYVDDGTSFKKRTPHGLSKHHVAKWISSGSDTSAYTGSFIDDGADMQLRDGATPGFGAIDKRFYKQPKPKEPKPGHETLWNEHVQTAITGDVQRNLKIIRRLGDVRVKKKDDARGGDGDGHEGGGGAEKEETVTVPVPPQWGTFVIRADDGRVIVVDEEGEFDSGGPVEAVDERPKPWVKAASTTVPPSSTGISVPLSPPKHQSKKEIKTRKHKTSKHLPPKILTSIPEAETEYEDGYLPATEPAGSPTNFLMTGGASGWPSRSDTSIASPAPSVSDGYEYVGIASPCKTASVKSGYRYVRPESVGYEYEKPPTDIVSKTASERSWNGGHLEKAWQGHKASHAQGSERSYGRSSSAKSQHEKKDGDEISMKSFATYKAPTVEEAPDTASEGTAAAGWGRGGKKGSNSVQSSPNTEKLNNNNKPIWDVPHPHTWAMDGKAPSQQSWDNRPKAADNPSWTGIQPSAFPHRAHSTTSNPPRPPSEAPWDGFERSKTFSDVSILGSGSERESQGSGSRHWSRASSTHKSRASHTRNSPTWNQEGEADQARWATGGAASQTSSKKSHHRQPTSPISKVRPDTRHAAGSWNDGQKLSPGAVAAVAAGGWDNNGATKYANGFEEPNQTYLNETWGGVPVRVVDWAQSVSPKE